MSVDWLDEAAAELKQADEQQQPKEIIAIDTPVDLTVRGLDGEVRTGTVTFHVPDLPERRVMTRLKNRMAGGVPWNTLATNDRDLISAQVAVAAMIRDIPPWLSQALQIDLSVLYQLWEAVVSHEFRFFRRAPLPGEAKPEEGQPPVIVRCAYPGDGRPQRSGGADPSGQPSATVTEDYESSRTSDEVADEVDLLRKTGAMTG